MKHALTDETRDKVVLIKLINVMLAVHDILKKDDGKFFEKVLVDGKMVLDGKPYGHFAFRPRQDDKSLVLSDFTFSKDSAIPTDP